MHNTESVLENETHKILWNFEVQMDHLILARRADLVIVKKKKKKKKKRENLPNYEDYRFGWPLGKTERKRKER